MNLKGNSLTIFLKCPLNIFLKCHVASLVSKVLSCHSLNNFLVLCRLCRCLVDRLSSLPLLSMALDLVEYLNQPFT